MSLDHLETQIQDLRGKAERVQALWDRTVKTVETDDALSGPGKRAKLDNTYDQLKSQLDDLRKQETDLVTRKRQSLEKSVFGLATVTSSDPNQIISYRDARDRAAKLEHADDAHALFDSALLSDDHTLASAILAQAIANGWHSIINSYSTTHPAQAADLHDLQKMQQYDQFHAAMSYGIFRSTLTTV